ncbi:hypothetical protein D3C81_1368900 [compost metagenome]
MDIVEGAMALGIVGDRTGKQLIPAGKHGLLALHIHRVFGAAAQIGAMVGLAHQYGGVRVQQPGHLLFGWQARQRLVQCLQLFPQRAVTALDILFEQQQAFLQLQRHGQAGVEFLFQIVAISGEGIDPGFDTEQVPPLFRHAEPCLPQVIDNKAHRDAMPTPAVGLAPVEPDRQHVMTVGIDLAAHLDRFADHRLDRKQPAIEHRLGVLDHDARFQQRLGQADGLLGLIVCRGQAVGFEGLIAGHRTLLRYQMAVRVQSRWRAWGSKKMSDCACQQSKTTESDHFQPRCEVRP